MNERAIPNARTSRECAATDQFRNNPTEESFAVLFKVFNPQLVSFFRSRTREFTSAEDLAQEVMLTVYKKANQVRDERLFRGWLFKVAHNALSGYYRKLRQSLEIANLAEVEKQLVTGRCERHGTHAFEFYEWMTFLDAHEREAMILRFVEQCEYHKIAVAQRIPIGTVQWRIFNCKKKLCNVLTSKYSARAVRRDCSAHKPKKRRTVARSATKHGSAGVPE
ncbi:MAG: sigma-70 family RNA polymerase sigma factor, partial [Acidobacteriaceae bacterium]|nr:sigma-70 family RNA polymerase sigma factor [Acidobacteriaceae bacterium]